MVWAVWCFPSGPPLFVLVLVLCRAQTPCPVFSNHVFYTPEPLFAMSAGNCTDDDATMGRLMAVIMQARYNPTIFYLRRSTTPHSGARVPRSTVKQRRGWPVSSSGIGRTRQLAVGIVGPARRPAACTLYRAARDVTVAATGSRGAHTRAAHPPPVVTVPWRASRATASTHKPPRRGAHWYSLAAPSIPYGLDQVANIPLDEWHTGRRWESRPDLGR